MTSASATAPKRALAARNWLCIPIACFRRIRPSGPWRARFTAACATCRSSARTDIPTPPGSPTNKPFTNATELLLAPDHYLFRMLYSQGIVAAMTSASARGSGPSDSRSARSVATVRAPLPSFRGTPSAMWLNYVFVRRSSGSACGSTRNRPITITTRIGEKLAHAEFRPRALFERFNIEVLATTESPVDTLEHHRAIRASGWHGRVITAYRPDAVVDPEHEDSPLRSRSSPS